MAGKKRPPRVPSSVLAHPLAPHNAPALYGRKSDSPLMPVPNNLAPAEIMAGFRSLEYLGKTVRRVTAGTADLPAAMRRTQSECAELEKKLHGEKNPEKMAEILQQSAAWLLYLAAICDGYKERIKEGG